MLKRINWTMLNVAQSNQTLEFDFGHSITPVACHFLDTLQKKSPLI